MLCECMLSVVVFQNHLLLQISPLHSHWQMYGLLCIHSQYRRLLSPRIPLLVHCDRFVFCVYVSLHQLSVPHREWWSITSTVKETEHQITQIQIHTCGHYLVAIGRIASGIFLPNTDWKFLLIPTWNKFLAAPDASLGRSMFSEKRYRYIIKKVELYSIEIIYNTTRSYCVKQEYDKRL